VSAEPDPAAPRFPASEPRVVATPFGRLDDEHPLRRVLRRIDYPAGAERVLSFVRSDPAVTRDQADWLESVLPSGRTFRDDADVVDALGAWGPPPPSAARSL
jgi:hypothetical protein